MIRFLKSLLFSIYFYITFISISILFYFFGLIFAGKRRKKWLKIGLIANELILKLSFLKIKVVGKENLPKPPFILCANHQSYLDGFILFYVTKIPFIAITAPFGSFPKLVEIWFKKVGYIEVARDIFEELHYKSALHRNEVIMKAKKLLEKKEVLLIFPEGRREFNHRLLPFHLGIAKIAIEAKVPVVPIILKGVDILLPPDRFLLIPHPIEIIIEKPVKLYEISKDYLKDVIYLEQIIKNHLPKRYFSIKSVPHYPMGIRAAFFDLDGTITKKNIWKIIVLNYFKKHFSFKNLLQLIKLIIYQKFYKHGIFYLRALRLLKDIEINEILDGIEKVIKVFKDKIFYDEMINLIEKHKEENNLVFIITEEPEIFIEPVLKFLNVRGFGTKLEVIDGKLTGKINGHILKGHHKKEIVVKLADEYGIDLSKSYAYGNSWNDYPMLRIVGHPYLVNPKKDLRKRGKELGFRIIYLK